MGEMPTLTLAEPEQPEQPERLTPPDRATRVLALVRARWALAAMAVAYAVTLAEVEAVQPGRLGVPIALFLLGLPVWILIYNGGTLALARRGAVDAATFLCLFGDLMAVTIGLSGTGGVASWVWTMYPLITLEAVFLTESANATLTAAVAGTILYALEVALEDVGVLPTLATPLTAPENKLPMAYWVLKDSWVALMNVSAAVAGLVALRAVGRVRAALAAAYRQLDRQYEALKQVDALKSQFLSVVSHELRTPLAIIQGYTELVEEDQGLSDDSRRYLDEAEGAVRTLGGKIEQMLAYSTLATGERGLELSEVRAVEAVAEAVARQEGRCRAAGLVILMEPTPELVLRADEARVVEAIAELIANACTATAPGGTVGVRTRLEGERVVFEVWDTGPGMPEAVVERLGEPFVQPSLKLTEHAPGLGLGLAYVRLVAALHGGTLAVGDRAEGGAVVALALPVLAGAEVGPPVDVATPVRP